MGQKWLGFIGVRAIKLVWFPDQSLDGGLFGVIEAISKSAKGLGKVGQYAVWSARMGFRRCNLTRHCEKYSNAEYWGKIPGIFKTIPQIF